MGAHEIHGLKAQRKGVTLGETLGHERRTGASVTVEPKILVVDDEHDLVDTCVRLLVPRGYRCFRAYTGTQAIALIDAEQFDLVLTDFRMPDLDGLSVLAHARAKAPPIPGIMMTAYSSTRTAGHAYDAGAVRYLVKPFAAAELIEAVDGALR